MSVDVPKVKHGQIWKDNKASGTRFVRVKGHDENEQRAHIVTFYRADAGELPVEIFDAQEVTARLDRFNGKRDGYSFAANSVKEFLDKKLHLADFVQMTKPVLASSVVGAPVTADVVGSVWKISDHGETRFVQILGIDGDRYSIVTKYTSDYVGGEGLIAVSGRLATFAKVERFNGKSKGYVRVADSLVDLESSYATKISSEPGIAAVGISAASTIHEVSTKQLWSDSASPLLRLVEVMAVDVAVVEVSSRYVQDKEDETPRRVHLNVTEEVDISAFENAGRFKFLSSL